MRKKIQQEGQSFFELVVALVVVSVVLVALVSLATKNISTSTFNKEKTLATRYVVEAHEWIRGERDTDWATFTSRVGSGTYCLVTLSWTQGGSSTGPCGANEYVPNTLFRRQVTLSYTSPPSTDSVNVTVVVTWVDSTGTHESRSSSVLTNWRKG